MLLHGDSTARAKVENLNLARRRIVLFLQTEGGP